MARSRPGPCLHQAALAGLGGRLVLPGQLLLRSLTVALWGGWALLGPGFDRTRFAAQELAPLGLPLGAFSSWSLPRQLAWPDDLLWTDVKIRGGWKMQQFSLQPRWRVLDPERTTVVAGSREACLERWYQLDHSGALPPVRGRVLLTLHGLGRTGRHMEGLGRSLSEAEGYSWINFSYASTRQTVEAHAAALAEVLEGLEDASSIDVVAHSLGNLVVRRYLGEAQKPYPRWKIDARLRRMVMLGPPNQGARLAQVLADLLRDHDLPRVLAGPSAWELARQWEALAREMATPSFPFAIVAGGTGHPRGLNPLVPGDDDGIVAVSETLLEGAAAFRVIPCRHGAMVDDERVRRFVRDFLTRGDVSPGESSRHEVPTRTEKQ